MKAGSKLYLIAAMLLSLSLLVSGCEQVGGGDTDTTGSTIAEKFTTIAGNVSLSSLLTSGKPSTDAAFRAKAGLKARRHINKGVLGAAGIETQAALGFATVELYDADKPEWLYPIGVTITDAEGSYALDELVNSQYNASAGATYTDGDQIPSGKYTLIASKYDSNVGKLFVAVQSIVKSYTGSVSGNDLVAQDSDAIPQVVSMFGLGANTDGTFGGDSTNLPVNAAIQVTFSNSMARLSVIEKISIKLAGSTVSGIWKVSPDLLSATFYPIGELTVGQAYDVTIKGGQGGANNVYGVPIPSDVTGTFTAVAKDITAPDAIRTSPTSSEKDNMSLTTPIRIGSDEPLDINSMGVASTPTIGDKPAIIFVGKSSTEQQYPFLYEILPSIPLKLATNYDITVSGGTDLAGNEMSVLNFNFTTEATSSGIDAGSTSAGEQSDVKNVFGKWIGAMNDRNVTMLTSLMSGDFFWLTKEGDTNDLNKDGRLSLKEFTDMLQQWFFMLEKCGATIDGAIVGSINVSGDTANFAFTLTATSTNTSDISCKEVGGPEEALYVYLKNINGSWLITNGSDYDTGGTMPTAYTLISLISPAKGEQLPEPVSQPAMPTFKWTGTSGVSTYAVIMVDTTEMWSDKGWVAFIDGAGMAGNEMNLTFAKATGWNGNTYVMPNVEAMGFGQRFDELVTGGKYFWSVIGFGSKTIEEFASGSVSMPQADIVASSPVWGLTVGGDVKKLDIQITGAGGLPLEFSPYMNGYDAGSAGSVTITVTTPDTTPTVGVLRVSGYTWFEQELNFSSGTASATVDLSQDNNWVEICSNWDQTNWTCKGIMANFNIFTTGGAAAVVNINSIVDDLGNTLTLDEWNAVYSDTAKTLDITGTYAEMANQQIVIDIYGDLGWYQDFIDVSSSGTFFIDNAMVFEGWNWVQIHDFNFQNQNGFSVQIGPGGGSNPADIPHAIEAEVVGGTMTWSDMQSSSWDVGSSSSATLEVTMEHGGNWNQYSSNWYWIAGSMEQLQPGVTTTISIELAPGMNYVDFNDNFGNWYELQIYTSSTTGVVISAPNTITEVDDKAFSTLSLPYQTSAATIKVEGTTTNTYGQVQLYVNYNNGATGQYFSDTYFTYPDPASGDYTFENVAVYANGSNWIDVYDGNWNWAGFEVKTSNTGSTAVQFSVAEVWADVTKLTPNQYSEYDALGMSKIKIIGDAKAGKTITAYVYGQYSTSATATAASDNRYEITVDIYNGYNSIDVTDGANWNYISVYTSGGATYTYMLPISNVKVSGSTMGYSDDYYSEWTTTSSLVTITGNNANMGWGTFYLNNYDSGQYFQGSIDMSTGSFSFPMDIMQGYNYIDIYDPIGNWYGLSVKK